MVFSNQRVLGSSRKRIQRESNKNDVGLLLLIFSTSKKSMRAPFHLQRFETLRAFALLRLLYWCGSRSQCSRSAKNCDTSCILARNFSSPDGHPIEKHCEFQWLVPMCHGMNNTENWFLFRCSDTVRSHMRCRHARAHAHGRRIYLTFTSIGMFPIDDKIACLYLH